MKIDFHFHAALSKKIGFELDFFRTTLQQAHQVGLDALAVTEHFNSSNIDVLYPRSPLSLSMSGIITWLMGLNCFRGWKLMCRKAPIFWCWVTERR
ncbi:MAG: hypothetical protein IPL78_20675 [Chloroflexi bacterium]|nr:hypothetical protein [Chloroflexota bacterium]